MGVVCFMVATALMMFVLVLLAMCYVGLHVEWDKDDDIWKLGDSDD